MLYCRSSVNVSLHLHHHRCRCHYSRSADTTGRRGITTVEETSNWIRYSAIVCDMSA